MKFSKFNIIIKDGNEPYREHLVDRKLLEIRIHNRLINESCTSGLRQ